MATSSTIFGGPRQQFADPGAGLAVLLQLVLRRGDGEAALAAGHRGEPLALADGFGQVLVEHARPCLRLVVEQVHLRRGAGHEQVDDALGLGGEVRQTGQAARRRRSSAWARAGSSEASAARAQPKGGRGQRSAGGSSSERVRESGPWQASVVCAGLACPRNLTFDSALLAESRSCGSREEGSNHGTHDRLEGKTKNRRPARQRGSVRPLLLVLCLSRVSW